MRAWVILHGDTEFGRQYWAGYSKAMKDHKFVRNKKYAIKFLTYWDATHAGVGLTKGILIDHEEYADSDLPAGNEHSP